MSKYAEGTYYGQNTDTHKRCPICKILKERSEYYKWASRKDGLTAYCKECMSNRTKNWVAENKEVYAESMIASSRKSRFGISREEYQKMLVDQNNQCGICKREIGWEAAVDHCHNTKKIRGLLCRKCNLGLGGFKDNIKIIEKAIKYVKEM